MFVWLVRSTYHYVILFLDGLAIEVSPSCLTFASENPNPLLVGLSKI